MARTASTHRRYLALVLLGAVALLASGCHMARAVSAWAQSKSHFHVCTSDARIVCEPGSETLARAAASALPHALDTVARAQFAPFLRPVAVYTYASRESYVAHTGQSRESAGSVFLKAVHLSPKLLDQEPARLPRILAHELSHLHLAQGMSTLAWSRVPGWFSEGLAVYVSHGGGAETVSVESARAAISQGKHFVPEATQSWLGAKHAASYGLEAHMYYRQAALFVEYLHHSEPAAFERLVRSPAGGARFDSSVRSAYARPLDELWTGFVATVKPPSVSD